MDLISTISKLGAPTLYLVGLVYMFRLYLKAEERYLGLLERYHAMVLTNTEAFKDLADRLEECDVKR